MANLIINITKAVACGNRVEAVLEMPIEREKGSQATVGGEVAFCNVTAQYASAAEPSLENITFLAQSGQTIGIIGGTGSGKTTLVNLIPGFYQAAKGVITIGGVDVREISTEALRGQIGIVPQKAVLFKGSVRENLLWGKADATDEELYAALELAQAREIVDEKEGGLDAFVEQNGTNFSGGQRQRLTIARALVRKPKILILDDSASALDYATDAKLRMAVRSMEDPPTTFIVSQRAASVRFADQIIVLEDGKMVGIGTHDTLLADCQVYQEIYYSQFPKEVDGIG